MRTLGISPLFSEIPRGCSYRSDSGDRIRESLFVWSRFGVRVEKGNPYVTICYLVHDQCCFKRALNETSGDSGRKPEP